MTDIDGSYSYAADIVWKQYIGTYKADSNSENWIDIYVPKCICVISRLPYFKNFFDCLMLLFHTLWKEKSHTLIPEKIISNIISTPKVFGTGKDPFKLTLHNDYSIYISPPLTDIFDATDVTVYFLAKHLGVDNLITVFNALLLDNKILFVSSSYNFLFMACKALSCLLYPFKFKFINY